MEHSRSTSLFFSLLNGRKPFDLKCMHVCPSFFMAFSHTFLHACATNSYLGETFLHLPSSTVEGALTEPFADSRGRHVYPSSTVFANPSKEGPEDRAVAVSWGKSTSSRSSSGRPRTWTGTMSPAAPRPSAVGCPLRS